MGDTSLPPPATHPTLTATMMPEVTRYSLNVTLQYSAEVYAPTGGGGFDANDRSAQVIRVARGQGAVVIEQQVGMGRYAGIRTESVCGLRVTDSTGRPFLLSGGFDLARFTIGGNGPQYVKLTLTATATEATKGPPARIAWNASRLAAVEVPFDLANVPVVK
jgi:hypothetical protein